MADQYVTNVGGINEGRLGEPLVNAAKTSVVQKVRRIMCLHLAVERSQGLGWSLYSGSDWVTPLPSIGTFKFDDDNHVTRQVAIDIDDRKVWETATFDRVNFITPSYVDKDEWDLGASVGTEIGWEKWSRNWVAKGGGEDTFEVDITKVFVRPQDDGNRGKPGYTEYGIRAAQKVSIDVYVDGEKNTPKATTNDVPLNGDYVFSGVKIESSRAQFVTRGTASELKIVSTQSDVIIKPKVAEVSLRLMTEHGYQADFANNYLLWISRDIKNPYNRISRSVLVNTGVTRVTGPDGRDKSAIDIAAGGSLVLDNALYSGNYTVMYWRYNGTSTKIQSISKPALSYGSIGIDPSGMWELLFSCGVGVIGDDLLCPAQNGIFDLRIYKKLQKYEAAVDYFNDTINNAGESYIPVF